MCGAIAHYNATEPPLGPRNLSLLIGKRITMRGFLVADHYGRWPEFAEEVGGWLREGKIQAPETVVEGIENAPAAFIGLLRGENTGKMLVRLASPQREPNTAIR
jgi:NADPH-dependent curcumin reductase CurA